MGIIPADAGSTVRKWYYELNTKGSSPRMRGAQIRPTYHSNFARIIPADAGST